jgi:hypothetical protein
LLAHGGNMFTQSGIRLSVAAMTAHVVVAGGGADTIRESDAAT